MTAEILIQIFLFGIALSMDAFAVSVTDGLTYTDINKRRMFFIAGTFGVMQALMPLIGYWLVEVVEVIVGQTAGEAAGNIMATVVTWIAFALLMYIGGKMLIEAIFHKEDESKTTELTLGVLAVQGIATSIDALSVGFTISDYNLVMAFAASLVIAIVTHIICLAGLELLENGLVLGVHQIEVDMVCLQFAQFLVQQVFHIFLIFHRFKRHLGGDGDLFSVAIL